MKKYLVMIAAAAVLLWSCSSVPITGRKQLNLVSDSEVLASSLASYKEYMASAKVSSNTTQNATVTRVGKAIAAATESYLNNNGMASEVQNFAWEFNLVQSDELNAFCMPGGKIVVYEGLMKIISSDDELAVMLEHPGSPRGRPECHHADHSRPGVWPGSPVRRDVAFLAQA